MEDEQNKGEDVFNELLNSMSIVRRIKFLESRMCKTEGRLDHLERKIGEKQNGNKTKG